MEKVPMRDGYGRALLELCKQHEEVIVLDADVATSTRTDWVRRQYADRYVNEDTSCTTQGEIKMRPS